jgi:Tfp pilus assembly protein PilF
MALVLVGCSADPAKQKAAFQAKAKVYLEQGKVAEATIELRNAAQADPQDADVHLALAQAYMQAGQAPQARDEYRRTLALKPKSVEAQADLAALLLAGANFSEAKPLIDGLLKDPKKTRAHRLNAQYLLGTDHVA